MQLEQLMGRYYRLRNELAAAYDAQPWQTRRIDRLAADLAATERDIAACGGADEVACDWPVRTLPSGASRGAVAQSC